MMIACQKCKDIKDYIARKNAELREVSIELLEVKYKDHKKESLNIVKAFAAGAMFHFVVSQFASLACVTFKTFLY